MNRFLYDEIILTKDEVRFCNKCLNKIVLTEDDTLVWSASFGNGFEMAKVNMGTINIQK